MAESSRAVSGEFVHKLRKLAAWAESNVKSSDDLIGEPKFRRRWSRFGVENTHAATDLWHQAVDEQQRAHAGLDEADAELRRLQSLTSSELPPPADDLDAFPAMRERLADADAHLVLTTEQLNEARRRKDAELEAGRASHSQLSAALSARQEELRNLEEVMEGEQQELESLRADVAKMAEVRDSLQRLVLAVNEQVGR